MTELAVKLQIKALEAMGAENAVVSIHRSIANGWSGLFPVNQSGSQSSGTNSSVSVQSTTPREKTIEELHASVYSTLTKAEQNRYMGEIR